MTSSRINLISLKIILSAWDVSQDCCEFKKQNRFSFETRALVIFASRIKEIEENLFERYTGILLEKFSPLTPYVNHLLTRLRAFGLIQHYWNDPLYLEQTMSMDTFTYYDDSKDKLTLDTFFLTFVFLGSGMVLALLCLIGEILVHRYTTRKAARVTDRVGNTNAAAQTRNATRIAQAQKAVKAALARQAKSIKNPKPKPEPRSMYDGSFD